MFFACYGSRSISPGIKALSVCITLCQFLSQFSDMWYPQLVMNETQANLPTNLTSIWASMPISPIRQVPGWCSCQDDSLVRKDPGSNHGAALTMDGRPPLVSQGWGGLPHTATALRRRRSPPIIGRHNLPALHVHHYYGLMTQSGCMRTPVELLEPLRLRVRQKNFGKWKRDEYFPMVSDTLSSMVHEKTITSTFRDCSFK